MKRSYSGYLYIVLCAVIFSTMEVMLKTVHGVFAPMQITCLRFLIGGLLLIPFGKGFPFTAHAVQRSSVSAASESSMLRLILSHLFSKSKRLRPRNRGEALLHGTTLIISPPRGAS